MNIRINVVLYIRLYYTSAHVVAGGILSYCRSFFLFFLSPQDLRDGSTDREPLYLRWSDIGVILKIGSKISGAIPH